MRLNPALAALRRDPAPQYRAQAALERAVAEWRDAPRTQTMVGELADFGGGASIEACPLLERLTADLTAGRALVGALCSPLLRALATEPLGHVPLRHQYAPGLAMIQLAEVHGAALSLLCYEAHAAGLDAPARTVCFGGGERHELCLAGAAAARVFTIREETPARADIECEEKHITAGDTLAFKGPHRTKIVDRPRHRLVLLRLSRGDPLSLPAREYRIADGALVHCASGNRAESCDEMAAAVLGAMGRSDAAPVLARIAGDSGTGDHLRWDAQCHALALDTATGFRALTAMAENPADSLAMTAGALRASLVERHPELAGLGLPCRA